MKKYLSLLFIFAISATNTAMAYDFSAVAPSGQTLYYNIKGNGVTLTYPEKTTWGEDGWKGYVKPTGALIIPSTVTYNNINYSVTSIKEYAFFECE